MNVNAKVQGRDALIVNAFSFSGQGGNPAGVMLAADGLSPQQRQTIAMDLGFSETAFVSKSDEADLRLEFFTPTRQIAQCGHATVAAIQAMSRAGLIRKDEIEIDTLTGKRKVRLLGKKVYLQQTAPEFENAGIPIEIIAEILGCPADEVVASPGPEIVSTGNRFLIVQLRTMSGLRNLAPDQDAIAEVSENRNLIGVYAYTTDVAKSEGDACARMFAPAYGIPEESATGMAAGPLACFLHIRHHRIQDTFMITQGLHMKPASPSRLYVELEKRPDRSIHEVWVGGEATVDVAGR